MRQAARPADRRPARPCVQFTADELRKLDEVSALPAEYPGWMLARQGSDRIPGAASPLAQKK